MRTEKVIWWLAIACAVLLLPSWLNPKTVRVIERSGMEIQGWGWQNVAAWAGFLAVIFLALGRANRPRVLLPVLCAGAAVFAFGGAAAEAARTWLDLTKEAANPELYGYGGGYELRPATGMGGTIGIALAGAATTLVLLGRWLGPGGKW